MKKLIGLLLVALAVSGCQRPAQLNQTDIPDSSTPIAGESVSPGNYTLSLGPQGDEREVILHFPPAYDGSSQLPLVIVLHGGGQNAAAFND